MLELVRLFIDKRILRLFCSARWHICVPIICGMADFLHNFLDLWSLLYFAVPTVLNELPQGIRDPDIHRIPRFVWTSTKRDIVREFLGPVIAKRYLSCQNLIECQGNRGDYNSTTQSPEV